MQVLSLSSNNAHNSTVNSEHRRAWNCVANKDESAPTLVESTATETGAGTD